MSGPYSRVYHALVDDPKFATVYDNDRLLATWLRLLIVAEQAYPASAPIPMGTNRAAINALVDAKLIDLSAGSRFRIRGLEAERTSRSEQARNAGRASGRARLNARSTRDELTFNDRSTAVELAEQSKSRAEQEHRDSFDGRADLEAFLVIKRRAPTARQRRLLDDVLDRHDLTGPAWAADVMFKHPDDPIGAVLEADAAYRSARIAEAQAAESPKPTPKRSRGLPQTTKDIMAEMALLRGEG